MHIAGIDEVGRGPLAGPVAIGVAWCSNDFDIQKEFPGLRDSKKLSEKKREEIYAKVLEIPDVGFVVSMNDAFVIDEKGISFAITDAVEKGCSKLPEEVFIYLDGRLAAPDQFPQKSVIGGDDSIPIVSLASVVAKVERDRLMKKLGEKYPVYGLEKHKGYGTKVHREAIEAHGFSPVHRRSFCKNIAIKRRV